MADRFSFDLANLKKTKGRTPNLAHHKKIREFVAKHCEWQFKDIQHRGDLKNIWDTSDKMFRCKPFDKDYESRADTATCDYAVAVHQLKAITFKTILEHLNDYRYIAAGLPTDEDRVRYELQADAFTAMLHMSLKQKASRQALSKTAHQFWKDGNCIAGVEWISKRYDINTWDGNVMEPSLEYVGPVLRAINRQEVWLDSDIEDLDEQDAFFIRDPISWTELITNPDFVLPEKHTRQAMALFLSDKASQYRAARTQAQENAGVDGDTYMPEPATYNRWVGWCMLPIQYENGRGTWDENGATFRHRIQLLGDPGKTAHCMLIEPNPFPLGVPFMAGHEVEDDIGFDHQSRAERVKTYYEQICIAQDQLIETREKNNRRPVVYDPYSIPAFEDYEFGASQSIPAKGSPKDAFLEMQISDMTGSNLLHIEHCERKLKEMMHATRAVLGEAMGARTSASEYMGARAAATAPIYEAIARFEDAIIIGYMEKFRAYVQRFMKAEDLVQILGPEGRLISLEDAEEALTRRYGIMAEGVAKFSTEMEEFQKTLQFYQVTQNDPNLQPGSTLEELALSLRKNPKRFLRVPSRREATKAALLENQVILQDGKWDEVEETDNHDVHLDVHTRGLFDAEQTGATQNVPLMQQHINKHNQFKTQAVSGALAPQLPQSSGLPEAAESTPGEQSGRELSAEQGNVQGGANIPLSA